MPEGSSGQADKSERNGTRDFFGSLAVKVAAIIISGVAIPAIFWGIWYAATGSIPKFLGLSRLLLDTVAGLFYAPIMAVCICLMILTYNDFIARADKRASFWTHASDFIADYLKLVFWGIFLIIDFIVSIFFSFATGLAGIVAFFVLIWAYRRALRMFPIGTFRVASLMNRIFG